MEKVRWKNKMIDNKELDRRLDIGIKARQHMEKYCKDKILTENTNSVSYLKLKRKTNSKGSL